MFGVCGRIKRLTVELFMLAPKGGYIALESIVLSREVIEQMGNPHRAHVGMHHGAQPARRAWWEKKNCARSRSRRHIPIHLRLRRRLGLSAASATSMCGLRRCRLAGVERVA